MTPPLAGSRLLINEHPLQVLPSLAVAIGLNEAIFVQQVHYWLVSSKHEHDGRAWIYNSLEEWQKQFPFWGNSTIRRTIDSLKSSGILLTGNYNDNGSNRTIWYSIDYDALTRIEPDAGPDRPFVDSDKPFVDSDKPSVHIEHMSSNPSAETDKPYVQNEQIHMSNLNRPFVQNEQMLIEQRLTTETTQKKNDDEGSPPPLFKRSNDDGDRGTNDGDDGDTDDGFDPYESLIEIEFAAVQATDALNAYGAANVMLDRAEVGRVAAYVAEPPPGIRNPRAFLAEQWRHGKVYPLTRKPVARPGPAWDNDTQRFEPQPATISNDVLEAARRLRADLDSRAPEPDQYVGQAAMAQALAGTPLQHIARVPLQFPGRK